MILPKSLTKNITLEQAALDILVGLVANTTTNDERNKAHQTIDHHDNLVVEAFDLAEEYLAEREARANHHEEKDPPKVLGFAQHDGHVFVAREDGVFRVVPPVVDRRDFKFTEAKLIKLEVSDVECVEIPHEESS